MASPESRIPQIIPLEGSNGRVAANVSVIGGVIESLDIDGLPVLISRDRGDGVLDTTHPVRPFSTTWLSEEKHGPGRYQEYRVVESHGDSVLMETTDPEPTGFVHGREVTAQDEGLTIIDTITNPGTHNIDGVEATWATSVGNHPYFAVKADQMKALEIHGKQGDGYLTAVRPNGTHITGTWKDFLPNIEKGESLVCNDVRGGVTIRLPEPNAATLELNMTARLGEDEQPVAYCLWSRGNGTVCIEPVAGVARSPEGELVTDLVRIGPGESIVLTTTIKKTA